MKKEYDFSNAEQGRFYQGNKPSQVIIHLPPTHAHPKFEVYQDDYGQFHFRLRDDQHTVFSSEGFNSKQECLQALTELKENSILAPTVLA